MTASTKNILIVSSEFPPQPGGIGTHAYCLAKGLHTNDYTVTVIADARSSSGAEEAAFDANVLFKVLRIPVTVPRTFMYLKRLVVLSQQLKQHDTVLATGKFSLWSVGFFSLFFKRNYISVIHGTEVHLKSSFLKGITNRSLQRFHVVIAVSNYTKSLVAHLSLNPIEVIPNGYDAQVWKVDAPHAISLKGSPKLITVGRISQRKGQHWVIAHLPKLIEKFPELHYHMVGMDSEAADLLMLVKTLKVECYVTIHGNVTASRLLALVGNSDMSVMLSSESDKGDVEGFGIALLEANALGIPTIGALGSGVEDAILNHKSGILVPIDDCEAFIEAVGSILNNQEAFTLGAKNWAQQHTWDVIIKRYLAVIAAIKTLKTPS